MPGMEWYLIHFKSGTETLFGLLTFENVPGISLPRSSLAPERELTFDAHRYIYPDYAFPALHKLRLKITSAMPGFRTNRGTPMLLDLVYFHFQATAPRLSIKHF
jgi:hypothetical protein